MNNIMIIFDEIEDILDKISFDELELNDELIDRLNQKINSIHEVFPISVENVANNGIENTILQNRIKQINEKFDNIIRNYKTEIEKSQKDLKSYINSKKIAKYNK